jgi:hypothetical protein
MTSRTAAAIFSGISGSMQAASRRCAPRRGRRGPLRPVADRGVPRPLLRQIWWEVVLLESEPDGGGRRNVVRRGIELSSTDLMIPSLCSGASLRSSLNSSSGTISPVQNCRAQFFLGRRGREARVRRRRRDAPSRTEESGHFGNGEQGVRSSTASAAVSGPSARSLPRRWLVVEVWPLSRGALPCRCRSRGRRFRLGRRSGRTSS